MHRDAAIQRNRAQHGRLDERGVRPLSMFGTVALLSALALVACADPGSSVDAGRDGAPVGVCCPLTSPPNCTCTPTGGWAASAEACSSHNICDVWPTDFREVIDERGCPTLEYPPEPETGCCNCPDAG